jgi:hypothetical protein
MKTFFGILKGFIAIYTFIAMYFTSLFSLSSIEEWDFQVKNNFSVFFWGRMFFTTMVGCLFLLLSLLLNRLFRKSIVYKKKYVLIEFLAIIAISALLVLKTIYWNR